MAKGQITVLVNKRHPEKPTTKRVKPNNGRKPPTTGEVKSRSSKAGLVFPVGRIHRMLRDGQYTKRINSGAPVALASVLEYLTAEMLELSGQTAKALKATRITPRHLLLALRQDEEMSKLFKGVTIAGAGVQPNIHKEQLKNKKKAIPSPKKKVVIKKKPMPKKKVMRINSEVDEVAPKPGDEEEERPDKKKTKVPSEVDEAEATQKPGDEEERPDKTIKKTKVPKRRVNRA